MFKKIKTFIIITILLLCLLYSLINPKLIISDIINATNIFLNNLFPSMFFFYTIGDLLVNYNFIKILELTLNKLFLKIFHISATSSFIIIISMLSGFPSGSKYITNFVKEKRINRNIANYLLTFTHFSNPLFILGMISSIYNKKVAIIVLLIHYSSNFILAYLIRPKEVYKEQQIIKKERKSFDIALKESFNNSFRILLIVFGNTCFFYTFSDIVTLFINNNIIKTIIYGSFDLTKGIIFLNTINVSNYFKILLILSFISFGGINVNFQVKQIISKEKLDYKYFLLGRISSLAISIILLFICFTIGII